MFIHCNTPLHLVFYVLPATNVSSFFLHIMSIMLRLDVYV